MKLYFGSVPAVAALAVAAVGATTAGTLTLARRTPVGASLTLGALPPERHQAAWRWSTRSPVYARTATRVWMVSLPNTFGGPL